MAIARGDPSNLIPGSGRVLPFWLVFGGVGQFVLPVPPESCTITMDNYAAVTRTKYGNHVDEWGPQPIMVDLAGTFGWSQTDNENGRLTGKQSAWFFANLKQQRDAHLEDDRADPETLLITFIDTKDGFITENTITNLKYTQDKSDPHLYRYQMHLIAVHVKRLFNGLAISDLPTTTAPPLVTVYTTAPPTGVNPFTTAVNLGSTNTDLHTFQVPAGDSLTQVSTLLYGSTAPAYLQSLVALNHLSLQAANAPLGVTTLQYRDRSAIVAPRVGQ